MELYSTKREAGNVNFQEAIFRGLPPDNGLYMPTQLPVLPTEFYENIHELSLQQIAHEVSIALIGDEIPAEDLKDIVNDAINFEAPVVPVYEDQFCLELFHGPSLAFKDFGARFMSRTMSWFLQKEKKEITILVATSGDTGSAVAQGFLGVDGIRVVILYPSGKVSSNQEKQLTTLGENITALEIDGVFDDCQHLVKTAFLDEDLNKKLNLSSANSINIARLIPQSFYYHSAYAQVKELEKPVVFSVPSGNFGNICGGMIARNMGLPVERFVASTNINDVVPQYIDTGEFEPRPSIATLSNAMDVGNPSNFPRMMALHHDDWDEIKASVVGAAYSDNETEAAIARVYEDTGYVMCPHTAVAWLGLNDYISELDYEVTGIFLSTAHPSKFTEIVSEVTGEDPEMPERLKVIIDKEKVSTKMSKEFGEFKEFLMNF